MGGRLKAALGASALRRVRDSPAVASAAPDGDLIGGRDHLAGRRAERRRRAAAGGQRRQRRDDRRARPGLRRGDPAERAGRQRAAAARAPAPSLVRRRLRARRARLQQQQLAARRVRVRDRLRHGAGRDLLVPQLPLARRVRPGGRLHHERHQAADRRALQLVPVRPVRRLGLVRAEGRRGGGVRDPLGQLGGQLPHPALGGRLERCRRRRQPRRARRRQRLQGRPDRDLAAVLRHLVGRSHDQHRRLLHARALPGRRADDARARQEPAHADHVERADAAARPARLDAARRDLLPRPLLRRGAAHRQPAHEPADLYCRMDLSPAAQVTASSSPTPGDAVGAFSVGAIDATTLLPESYSSEGPTDDGRNKPDITAPTNVLITPGDPEAEALTSCGGTSCATPHVGGAAALLWPGVAADGGAGSVAQRVRDRLVAQALDMGTPGTDTVFGAGRLRLDLAAPVLGRAVAGQQRARARNGRARVAGRRCGHARVAAAHGRRQAARGHAGARRHPARQLADRGAGAGSARPRPRGLRPERQQRHLPPHAARRQPGAARAPARAPAHARGRQAARRRPPCSTAAAAWPAGRASLSATARTRTASTSRTATSARGATRLRSAPPIAPGTARSSAGRCACAPVRRSQLAGGRLAA